MSSIRNPLVAAVAAIGLVAAACGGSELRVTAVGASEEGAATTTTAPPETTAAPPATDTDAPEATTTTLPPEPTWRVVEDGPWEWEHLAIDPPHPRAGEEVYLLARVTNPAAAIGPSPGCFDTGDGTERRCINFSAVGGEGNQTHDDCSSGGPDTFDSADEREDVTWSNLFSHTYERPGQYTWTVSVKDHFCATHEEMTAQITFTVLPS